MNLTEFNTTFVTPDDYVNCTYILVLGADTYCHENLNVDEIMTRQITHAILKIGAISVVIIALLYLIYNYVKQGNEFIRKEMDESIFSFLDVAIEELKKEKMLKTQYTSFSSTKEIPLDSDKETSISRVYFSKDLLAKMATSRRNVIAEFENEFDSLKDRNQMLFDEKHNNTKAGTIDLSDSSHSEENQKFVYLCNCQKCFSIICFTKALRAFYFRNIDSKFQFIYNKSAIFLLNYTKITTFWIMMYGPFFFLQLNHIFSIFFISPCLWNSPTSRAIYAAIDYVLGCIYFFNYIFIISFLSTKAELLAIDPEFKFHRGMIIFFHIKKAAGCSLIHIFIKTAMVLINDIPMFDLSMSKQATTYWLVRNIFFILFARYNSGLRVVPIENDSNLLKNYNIYYTIQNSLIKYTPREQDIYKIIQNMFKKNIRGFCRKRIMDRIKRKCDKAQAQMKAELEIVKNQRFMNIVRNRGEMPFLFTALFFWLFLFDCPFTVISCIMMLLDYANGTTLVVSCIIILGELTVIPLLIHIILRKKTLLGEEEYSVEAKKRKIYLRVFESHE